ncbi:urea ABC transporter permease subunit UrtB [Denitrobaculum tricleocarpae]|uniref:Urea ABC transporter permease subunit UrtB n=1 Tax=Denitrobaculum tricleocarpae TaxID=2591009 RepID=A0A545U0R7_9PROT|nr:urea ABC transporter permease subunit UrtB [Denitrobaculum tricleocarpae]TQV83056.1 urea ABC transporter permease subunit UrtB [Denitrobaculum tricleocarpae]
MYCLRFLLIPLLCALIFTSNTSQPAQAADLETALSGLAEKSFKARLKAVDDIAATQDERAAEVLDALVKRQLFITKADGHIVLPDPAQEGSYLFAFNGETAGDFSKSALKRVKINNRMRSAVRKALGTLTLGSADRNRRLAAARSIFNTRDSSALELLDGAIAKETDSRVKREMERARAAALLASDAEESDKLAAIDVIAPKANQDALALLTQVVSNDSGAVAERAERAIAEMQSALALWATAQNVVYGISLGSVLLLAAIGLAITFGVMGVINMAHGEMVMIGAYVTFVVQDVIRTSMPDLFDWSLLIALPLAFGVTALIGIAMERGIIRFLYGRPLETLLATWGVSLILQQAVRSIFGPNNRLVGNPSWMSGSLELGQLTLTYNRICIIAFTLVVFAALFVAMRKTSFGLQMRAVVQNRQMSAAMGIRTKWVDALTFGLGSGIAGLAGVAISQIDNVGPNLGQSYIIDSFMVVVFGGVGNLWGTLVGAMTLGVANKFLEPYSGAVLAKILVLVFIILFIQKRPKGLFALKGRGAEA